MISTHAQCVPRFGRRSLLRAGAAGACGLSLGLTGLTGEARAAPRRLGGSTELRVQLWVVGIPLNQANTTLIQNFLDQTFNARQKGLRAVFVPPGNETGVVSALIAGAPAPQVVSSDSTDWLVILPFLEDLQPYLKSDNIDPHATWGAGQLSRFRSASGLYGLPTNAACDTYLYRQDILDALGLTYPDPAWTWTEALALWRRCTGGVNGQWRYGTNCPFGPTTSEGLPTVVAGFGGALMDATGTRCLLNTPGSIRAGDYWFGMVWDKVATWGDGSPNPAIASGQLVFNTSAAPTVLFAVTQLGAAARWDFIPWPRFAVRPVGKLHDNFYGMLSTAPDKEAAWTMLKWAAIGKEWARFYSRLTLAPPARADMMEEWYALLRATAPILRNKHLEYWGEPTLKGWGVYDNQFFKYAPLQAQNALMSVWPALWNHQLGVAAGFQRITQEIDALQAAGAQVGQPATAQQILAAGRKEAARLAGMFAGKAPTRS